MLLCLPSQPFSQTKTTTAMDSGVLGMCSIRRTVNPSRWSECNSTRRRQFCSWLCSMGDFKNYPKKTKSSAIMCYSVNTQAKRPFSGPLHTPKRELPYLRIISLSTSHIIYSNMDYNCQALYISLSYSWTNIHSVYICNMQIVSPRANTSLMTCHSPFLK